MDLMNRVNEFEKRCLGTLRDKEVQVAEMRAAMDELQVLITRSATIQSRKELIVKEREREIIILREQVRRGKSIRSHERAWMRREGVDVDKMINELKNPEFRKELRKERSGRRAQENEGGKGDGNPAVEKKEANEKRK